MTDAHPLAGQLTLLDEPRAHARRSDPSTSHAAAASLEPDELRESQLAVLRVFQITGGRLHDDQMIAAYSELGMKPQSVSGLRTRRSELVDRGLVRDSGDRVRLVSGRLSIVWELKP